MNYELLYALLRSDFYTFVERVFREVAAGEVFTHNWHIEAICHVLSEIERGERRRQIIEVPPRSLKSIIASVALPAWRLGHDPTAKIMCVSYSQNLADRLAAMCRQVMKSSWYAEAFPATRISPTKDTESYFRTTAGGYRDATSIGGTLTGKGAAIIILDDPAKPDEMMSQAQREAVNRWYDQTLVSRLNNKATDAIVLVMQRLHLDDLAGHVRQSGKWETLTLPAIGTGDAAIPLGHGRVHQRFRGDLMDPVREPMDVLMQLKQTMGSYAFSAQYQQQPVPPDSSIVEWDWFIRVPAPPSSFTVVQSWDCAAKAEEFSDYTVCTTWGIDRRKVYLLDVFRKKLTFPELYHAVCQRAYEWQPKELLIEDSSAGTAVIQQLRWDRPMKIPQPKRITPVKDKQTRLHVVSAIIERGQVHLPERAPWLEAFREELVQFPYGRHDDQVDSMTQFLAWFDKKNHSGCVAERRSMFFD
ncbi:MAG: phage terminase large subunit [Paracoccaceae bacterium]